MKGKDRCQKYNAQGETIEHLASRCNVPADNAYHVRHME